VRRLVLASDADAALAASAWLRTATREEQIDHEGEFRLDLCLTELVSNIVMHGSATRIEIDLDADERCLVLKLVDDGPPFDPLTGETSPRATTLESAEPGGAGLPLIRAFCDEARHAYEGGRNVLVASVLRKHADAGLDDTGAAASTTAVRQCPLFASLAETQIDMVAAHAEIRAWRDGEVILRPGEPNRHVAVVLEGALGIHLDATGNDEPLVIPVGECVGEMSVVDARPVSALVVARGDCRLLAIDAEAFLEHVLPLPSVARRLMATLAARMRSANARVVARIRETAELERVRRELAFASELQTAMLPHRSPLFPDHPVIDCAGRQVSAREVGGDLFDAFFVDPDRLFLVIGDVCDKGIPAALYMVRTLTLLRAEVQAIAAAGVATRRDLLALAVARVNETLFEGHDGAMFVSLWCGLLELSTGILSHLNAGHLPPVLLRGDLAATWLTADRNPIVGVVPDRRFRASETQLAPGEALLLYTDGVTEAESSEGEQFGEERLLAVAEAHRGLASEALLAAVLDGATAFAGDPGQRDDVTVLCLRVRLPA
jgi:phosphoserine phosphatase RsbU/P